MNRNAESPKLLDGLAAHLASLSGVSWERLQYHPGYERNYWRDRARELLSQVDAPPAVRRWIDKPEGGWVVKA